MKKLIVAVLLLGCVMLAYAINYEYEWEWSWTVADTDTLTMVMHYDTSRIMVTSSGSAADSGIWRTIRITDRDTLWSQDTLRLITESAPLVQGPWTLFDTLAVGPASTNDTTIQVATRMTLDSGNLRYHPFFRVRAEHMDTVLVADTAEGGNTYKFRMRMTFNWR